MVIRYSQQIDFCGHPPLGILQCGDPLGKPLFYFHGFPGSRLEIQPADRAARISGIRLIGVDRPGYGRSGARPGRRLLDWPADIVRLADQLGLQRFSVLGVSGGGPYAAACAFKIPGRLAAVGICGGLAPMDAPADLADMGWFNRGGLTVAGCCPPLVRPILILIRWILRRRPEGALAFVARRAGDPDTGILRRPDLFSVMRASFRESMRPGIQGAVDDLRIYSRPWGFRIKDIRAGEVYLWHGEKDRLVPPQMGRKMAASMVDCRARFYPHEGHFSLVFHRMDEILSQLAGAPRQNHP